MSRSKPAAAATLIAVACTSYLVADVAHEALGHGGMCLALGGKLLFLSTTFEDCSIRSRLIDGAGPVMGIVVALCAWAWLRVRPPQSTNSRSFLLLTFAFAIFWNVFYLIRSGITDQGDWAFVIAGLKPKLAWHVALTLAGILLYALAMRMSASLMRTKLAGPENSTGKNSVSPFAFNATAFAAAVVLSAFAAHFDRRAIAPDFIDTLPSALASLGLVWVGWTMTRQTPQMRMAVPQSMTWTTGGLVCAIFFIAVLGPGLRF